MLRHAPFEAVVHGGRRWSYEDWNSRVNRAAHALADLGIRPFDRVALFLEAGEPSATLYFACHKLGAIAVPVNCRLAPRGVAHVLRDCGARLFVSGGSLADRALKAAAEVKGSARSWSSILTAGCPRGITSTKRCFAARAPTSRS